MAISLILVNVLHVIIAMVLFLLGPLSYSSENVL